MVTIETRQETRPVTSHEPAEVVAPPVTSHRRGRRRGRWFWLLAFPVLVIGLTFASAAGRHQWALSFIRQPTPYTTLSFQDAAGLPTTVTVGARVHLSFTVANQEGRPMDYAVVMSSANLGDTHARTVLRRTTLAVPAAGQRTTSVAVRPVCTASPCELQVALPGHPETIDVVLDVHRHAG
jgi:hypothetical protein